MSELQGISLRERIRLNLISAMERAGINQVQLADKLGISKGTVNNWARGNNSPDVDMVPRICQVLDISIVDFYSPAKNELPPPVSKKSPGTTEAVPENELERESIRLFENLSDEQKDFFLALLRLTAARNQGLSAADLVSAGEEALKAGHYNSAQ